MTTRAPAELLDALDRHVRHAGPVVVSATTGGMVGASSEWGAEADDSPMAGAAAYGMAPTAADALEALLLDAGELDQPGALPLVLCYGCGQKYQPTPEETDRHTHHAGPAPGLLVGSHLERVLASLDAAQVERDALIRERADR